LISCSSCTNTVVVDAYIKIEHLGTVSSIELDSRGCKLTISNSAPVLNDCHIGDSIAVNGACLTVTEFEKVDKGGWFTIWLANETLSRTNLGELKAGDQVNLERAMRGDGRFGGHYVQGHVDTTATIVEKTPDGDSLRIVFQLEDGSDASVLPCVVPKGFIALDGTSLTLTSVTEDKQRFGVMLITHTQEKITLSKKPIGSKVNVEADVLLKSVQKGIEAGIASWDLEKNIRLIVEDALAKALGTRA